MQPGQRVRSLNDGQIGHIVTLSQAEGGGIGVQLDRREKTIVPYRPGRWAPDEKGRLTPIQVASICYAADAGLRLARGEYGVKEWRTLPEPDRLEWLSGPPKNADAERLKLYAAVRGAFPK